jgi:hypothetical protein
LFCRALFLHHAGRRPFNLAHDADRLRSGPASVLNRAVLRSFKIPHDA